MSAPEALFTAACPQCGAAYQVPLAKIGPKGRKLKCAQCGQLWVVPPPQAAPAAEAAPAPAPPEIPDATPPADAPAPELAAPPVAAEAPLAEEPQQGQEVNLDVLTRPAWHAYVWGEQKWLTVAMGLTLLGALAASLALWQQLAPPGVAPAPTLAEEPMALPTTQVVTPPAGLVLHEVQGVVEPKDNDNILTIHGTVVNTASHTLTLPTLRAELVDTEGVLQDFQPIELASTTLPPALAMDFAVSFTNPLGTGWRLNWVGQGVGQVSSTSGQVSASAAVKPAPLAQ
jgi:predicted Zn finger-like uncharacterized protein